MARNPKLTPGIQVFLGSRPKPDVFAANSGIGCCPDTGPALGYDKLAERTRFDNSLAHLNPTGANDKFVFPFGNGFSENRNSIIDFINAEGEGAYISVLAIPTYAFVTGIGIHVASEEPGLTFDLVTRNGLVLPGVANGSVMEIETSVNGCDVTRVQTAGDGSSFEGFGAIPQGAVYTDIFGRYAEGEFSLEADEIALKVATMPSGGLVKGQFEITISVSYDIINRAEA